MSYVKIGVAGPVGSGKTALIEALSRKMAKDYSIGVGYSSVLICRHHFHPSERVPHRF